MKATLPYPDFPASPAETAPLKIALLAAAISPNTRSWAEGLADLGHRVEILTFHPEPLAGVDVHGFASGASKLGYLLQIRQVRSALKQIEPDIVIGYHLPSYGLVAALSWKGPLVLTPAGSDILRPRAKRFPFHQVNRYLSRRADLFVAWAPHMADQLRRLGVPAAKTLVLHRGIDESTFRQKGARSRGHELFQVVSTRSLKPVYDLGTTLEAVALLRQSGLDVGLQVIGSGPLADELQRLAQSLRIASAVHFRGYQPPQEVAARLRGADAYLSTSLSDGASSSLFEAMACGAFPVVTDIPANRAWVEHGVNGCLASAGDPADFAAALKMALTSASSRQAAAERNALIVRERLSRSRNLQAMTRRFRELLCPNPKI
jgi:L-malate glycosyltransferase